MLVLQVVILCVFRLQENFSWVCVSPFICNCSLRMDTFWLWWHFCLSLSPPKSEYYYKKPQKSVFTIKNWSLQSVHTKDFVRSPLPRIRQMMLKWSRGMRGRGGWLLLSSGLTPEGKGIRHLEILNHISQRAAIIERGNVAVMGNIQKITVCGHLELSQPLEDVPDKLR